MRGSEEGVDARMMLARDRSVRLMERSCSEIISYHAPDVDGWLSS